MNIAMKLSQEQWITLKAYCASRMAGETPEEMAQRLLNDAIWDIMKEIDFSDRLGNMETAIDYVADKIEEGTTATAKAVIMAANTVYD